MADLQNPYRQLPSETGGQAYHMECEFCKEWGSMYSSAPFVHTADCPAGKLEQEEFAAMRKFEEFIASADESETPKTGKFTFYQGCIRRCYYTAKHGGWGLSGVFGTIGFLLLAIPRGLYYRIAKKTPPDLELI